jgi:hypothetical protein
MKTLAAAALAALATAGAASADVWRIQFTAAGQAAARAVVVTRADLGAASGWAGGSVKPDLSDTPPCAGFHPKQSDLTVTGAAETRWQHAGVQIDSEATVLRTPQMVELDWQRTVVAPQVTPCLREGLAKQVGSSGKLVSFGRVAFPSYAPHTRAYRAVIEVTGAGGPVRVDTDVIVLGKQRTEITLSLVGASANRSVNRRAELVLARKLAARVRA